MDKHTPPHPAWDWILPPARVSNALGLEMGSEWSLMPALPSHICFKATGEVSRTILLFSSIFFCNNERVSLVYAFSFIFYSK